MSPKDDLRKQYEKVTSEPLPDYSKADDPFQAIPVTTLLIIISPFIVGLIIYALCNL